MVGARCLSAGRTWDSRVDQQGFEPPPAVCQRWQDQRQLSHRVASREQVTREWTLRGWVSQQYSKRDSCCLPGNNLVRMSHVSGWLLIRLLHVFEFIATQWVFTTLSLANLLWFFLLGSCSVRCLLCCLSDGETQIWLGDLRLALCFWFVFWLL